MSYENIYFQNTYARGSTRWCACLEPLSSRDQVDIINVLATSVHCMAVLFYVRFSGE